MTQLQLLDKSDKDHDFMDTRSSTHEVIYNFVLAVVSYSSCLRKQETMIRKKKNAGKTYTCIVFSFIFLSLFADKRNLLFW